MEVPQSEKLINQCHAAAGVGCWSQPPSCLKTSTCSLSENLNLQLPMSGSLISIQNSRPIHYYILSLGVR